MQGMTSNNPTKAEVVESFDVEKQFEFYLKMVKLDRRKMPPYQLTETKRAFFGAFGQFIVLLSTGNTNLLTQQELDEQYGKMTKQVSEYWIKENLSKQ